MYLATQKADKVNKHSALRGVSFDATEKAHGGKRRARTNRKAYAVARKHVHTNTKGFAR